MSSPANNSTSVAMESYREERTVQEIALNNPIILTEILKRASTSLKSCRLVCHFWNEMVLSALPNPTIGLKLEHDDKNCDNAVEFFGLCFALDDRLAKWISVSSDTPSFDYKLIHVCEKFSDRVQILELYFSEEFCLKLACQVLKNWCPNLKQLRISCSYIEGQDLDLFPSGEEQIFPVKSALTSFNLECWNLNQFHWALANFIELVVKASPNLRELAIPWGFYPDLGNSKCLETLHISLNRVDPVEIEDAENAAKLSEMLHQVDDQLVSLCIGLLHDVELLVPPGDTYDFEDASPIGFHLSKRMPKLRTYCNRIVEMFRCADLLQNIEMMPFLETLVIGRDLGGVRRVDEILQGICNARRILSTVKNLKLMDVYDARLLDAAGTAFPNVERLEVVRWLAWELGVGNVRSLEVGVVLEACRSWVGLKHLTLGMSEYPAQMVGFVRELLQGRELFQRLTTFEIHADRGNFSRYEMTQVEMDLFKEMLLVMDGMDEVTFLRVSLNEGSVANVLTFMEANGLNVAKFRLQDGSPYRVSD